MEAKFDKNSDYKQTPHNYSNFAYDSKHDTASCHSGKKVSNYNVRVGHKAYAKRFINDMYDDSTIVGTTWTIHPPRRVNYDDLGSY